MLINQKEPFLLDNQSGFVLVMAILILLVLSIIGMSTTKDAQIDLLIAGNDKVSKQTFYQAEGGTELASRMVEENVACPTGFAASSIGNIRVLTGAFWQTIPANLTDPTLCCPDFGDANNDGVDDDGDAFDDRAFYYIPSAGQITNVIVAGKTEYEPGSAIQMTSGYEGKGKGASAGGASINYHLISQGRGAQNSVSELEIIWRHKIGQEGDCNY